MKVAADARLEVARLADVQELAVRTAHPVNARTRRQPLNEGLGIESAGFRLSVIHVTDDGVAKAAEYSSVSRRESAAADPLPRSCARELALGRANGFAQARKVIGQLLVAMVLATPLMIRSAASVQPQVAQHHLC